MQGVPLAASEFAGIGLVEALMDALHSFPLGQIKEIAVC